MTVFEDRNSSSNKKTQGNRGQIKNRIEKIDQVLRDIKADM